MSKLAGKVLTTRGVAAFWLSARPSCCGRWPGRTFRTHSRRRFCKAILRADIKSGTHRSMNGCCGRVQQIAGPGPLSYLVLRYALMAATRFLLLLRALLRTVKRQCLWRQPSPSRLCSSSGSAGSSIIASLIRLLSSGGSLALLITALGYADRPTATRAFGLGLVIGLGTMAKWSFLLVVVEPRRRACLRPQRRGA